MLGMMGTSRTRQPRQLRPRDTACAGMRTCCGQMLREGYLPVKVASTGELQVVRHGLIGIACSSILICVEVEDQSISAAGTGRHPQRFSGAKRIDPCQMLRGAQASGPVRFRLERATE